MRTDYAYQDAIRRDFRNKVSAVIAVGLLALVLTGAMEGKLYIVGDTETTGMTAVNVGVADGDPAVR